MKRIFVVFIILMLVFSMLPAAALAESSVATGLYFKYAEEIEDGNVEDVYIYQYEGASLQQYGDNIDPYTYPITYQWYKDGVPIPGEICCEIELYFDSEDDLGTYTIVITDGHETIERSWKYANYEGDRSLTVTDPHDTQAYGKAGDKLTLNATAINSSFENIGPAISYQWKKGTEISMGDYTETQYTDIPGATSDTYTIPSLDAESAGSYLCYITDGIDEINHYETVFLESNASTDFGFTVGENTEIFLKSEDTGKELTLSADATNCDTEAYPITYQWYRKEVIYSEPENNYYRYDFRAIDGATQPTYTFPSLSLDDANSYKCEATCLGETLSREFVLASAYFLEPDEVNISALPGNKVELNAEAKSTFGNHTYTWRKGGVVLNETSSTLIFDAVEAEDFCNYTCIVTAGDYRIEKSFRIGTGAIGLEVQDIIAVKDEQITISIEVSIPIIYGAEEDWFELHYDKYDKDGEHLGEWNYIIRSGIQLIESHEYREDGYLKKKVKWVINAADESMDGIYSMHAVGSTGDLNKIWFEISVKDYAPATLLHNDGFSIEGVLHPGAKLNMRPLENHIRNYFKKHMKEDVEIIWENDVTLEIFGEADEHKGDLTLNIPVNKKYDGMKLTVLHYTGGEVEELEGVVKDGILTITTKSLSPFAVIAPEETGSDENGEITGGESESSPGSGEPDSETPSDDEAADTDKKDDIPDTGDISTILLAAAALIAISSIAALILIKKAACR